MNIMSVKIIQGLLLSSLLFLVASCNKESGSPVQMVNNSIDSTAQQITKGSFQNGPYGAVSGTAEIFNNQDTLLLQLRNFQTSNGPDLHVYLSKERMPVQFIDLGKIQSTNGNQVYLIPGKPDFNQYRYVVIHCVAFNHLFGYAEVR